MSKFKVGDEVHFKYKDTVVNGRVSSYVTDDQFICRFKENFQPFIGEPNTSTYSKGNSWRFYDCGKFVSQQDKGVVLFKEHYKDTDNDDKEYNWEIYNKIQATVYEGKTWDELVELSDLRELPTSPEQVLRDYYVFYKSCSGIIYKADVYKINKTSETYHLWVYGILNSIDESFVVFNDDFTTKSQGTILVHKVDISKRDYLEPRYKTITEEILTCTEEAICDLIETNKFKTITIDSMESLIKEENIMTRKTVKVELFDNDKGLDVQHSLVFSKDNVLTEDTPAVTIQELMMNEDIAGALEKHNTVRTKQKDLDILKRTGNKVNLEPVKLKQLTWVVDGVTV